MKLFFSFGAIWDIEKYKTSIGLSVDDIDIKLSSSSKTKKFTIKDIISD